MGRRRLFFRCTRCFLFPVNPSINSARLFCFLKSVIGWQLGAALGDPPTPPTTAADELVLPLHPAGGGMDGSTRSSLAVARLPNDALVEILSRLRAKSLSRSKCVSKPWRDLITDRLGCKNLPQTLQGFLYFDAKSRGGDDNNDNSDGDSNRDLASNREKMLLRHGYGHFINLLGKSMPLLDLSFAFMKEQPGIEAITILDSCNGLLLFGNRHISDTYDSLGYIVCNPITEQWVAVPSSGWIPTPPEEILEDYKKELRTFLIFDPSVSSHFDIVEFWQDGTVDDVEGVHTYSSGTGLWTDRSSSEWRRWEQGGGWGKWGGYGAIEKPRYSRALVNGMLHFLFYKFRTDVYEIVAVDGQGKTCRVIRWPYECPFPLAAFISQSQGQLHCITELVEGTGLRSPGLSIWVLEDYDSEEWVLKHNMSFWSLFGEMDFFTFYSGSFHCVGLHTDRNLMFLVRHSDRKLISYDMDSREVYVLSTLEQRYSYITQYVPSFKSL